MAETNCSAGFADGGLAINGRGAANEEGAIAQ
jgi:hypothetical protein